MKQIFRIILILTIFLSAAAFSKKMPGGHDYAYMVDGKNVAIFDMEQGSFVSYLKSTSKNWTPTSVTLTPDKQLAFIVNSNTVVIFDVKLSKQIAEIAEFSDDTTLTDITISPDGKYAYIGIVLRNEFQGQIAVYDIKKQAIIHYVKYNDDIYFPYELPLHIIFSHDGKKAVAVTQYNTYHANALLIDTQTDTVTADLHQKTGSYISGFIFSPDDNMAYVRSDGSDTLLSRVQQIKVLDMSTYKVVRSANFPHLPGYGQTSSMEMTADGNKIYLYLSADSLFAYDVRKNSISVISPGFPSSYHYCALAFSTDETKVYLSGDATLVLDSKTDTEIRQFNNTGLSYVYSVQTYPGS